MVVVEHLGRPTSGSWMDSDGQDRVWRAEPDPEDTPDQAKNHRQQL